MHRVIIVDDESKMRELLASKLTRLFPSFDIIAMVSSVREAHAKCLELKPDIVFLDVQMPLENGFDFIQKFENIDFEIIFATAFQEYALQAFRVSATGFVLKPYSDEDLEIAVNSAIEQLNIKQTTVKYEALLENIKPHNSENQKLVIPCKDRYQVIQIDEILYCEGEDKYTNIFIKDGRKILSSYYIGKFKTMLPPESFFVSHKSYIVNINAIKALTTDDEIVLQNDKIIPLARRRKVEFMQALVGR